MRNFRILIDSQDDTSNNLSMSSQQLYFVTGKGGVGKSTIAALIARNLARQHKKTLLIEIGDYSYYQRLFQKEVSFQPTEVAENLHVAHWQWYRCLKEYVTHVVKVQALTDLFFENAVMKTVIQVAPGLAEIALLGKFTSQDRRVGPIMPYDAFVMDAHATGHALSMLRAPKGLFQTIGFGPLGEHSKSIYESMLRPGLCKYVTVCLPEELPIIETNEFISQLRNEFGVPSELWLNKWIPLEFNSQNIQSWQKTIEKPEGRAFVDYLSALEQRQQNAMDKLVKGPTLVPYKSNEGSAIDWLDKLTEEIQPCEQ